VERQWDEVAGWGIGADVVRSWQVLYPNLFDGLLNNAARNNYQRLAQECTFGSFVEGVIRHDLFKQDFFSENPVKDLRVSQILIDQTPTPYPADLPLMLVQGTADQIVLAGPNADLQEAWCAAGSTINGLWLGGVDHIKINGMAGPSVAGWIADRFAGRIAPNSCDVPPPRSLITVQ
jgi:hypothetical protein